MDEYTLGKDIASLESRVSALEEIISKQGCGCGQNAIEDRGIAQKTDSEPTVGISMRQDPDADAAATERFSNGHIRRKTVNGVCYCQMYCNGWQYFCWDNGRCVQCSDRPVTVNCAGNNWILDC